MTTRPTNSERLREMVGEATPGPWRAFTYDDGDGTWHVVTGNQWRVATCPSWPLHNAEGRARLIALAPDAIALLADMGEAWELFSHIGECGDHPEHLMEAEKTARAFVARLDALCGDER